jgi:hypothetical protein
LFRYCLQRSLEDLDAGAPCAATLTACLAAADDERLIFIDEASHDAAVEESVRRSRAAGVFFLSTTLNLSDDLSDGEAGDYLERPSIDGPLLQLHLHTLGLGELAAAGLGPHALQRAARRLVEACTAQHEELREGQWGADRYREVAEGIGAAQFSSYLELLWAQTPLADRADAIGRAIGFASLLVVDLRSDDERLPSDPGGLRDICVEALERLEGLDEELRAVRCTVPGLRAALREEIA